MIYFVKDSASLAIKIGYSKKPKKRVASLQTANPHKLLLLGIVTGTEADETAYHVRFADYRLEGEWFNGEIIEEVLTIISEHKQRRLEIRRRTMTQTTSESTDPDQGPAPSGQQGVLDKDNVIRGVCRIPSLKLKSFSLKLIERPVKTEEQLADEFKIQEAALKGQGQKGQDIKWQLDSLRAQHERSKAFLFCGLELKYLLEFETNVTNDNIAPGSTGDLQKLQQAVLRAAQQSGLWHTFYDDDNAVIPFRPAPSDCHIVGGAEAITGCQGDAFRVLVAFEKQLDRNHHGAKIKDVFMGENYTGEHPLKNAKKLVISLR